MGNVTRTELKKTKLNYITNEPLQAQSNQFWFIYHLFGNKSRPWGSIGACYFFSTYRWQPHKFHQYPAFQNCTQWLCQGQSLRDPDTGSVNNIHKVENKHDLKAITKDKTFKIWLENDSYLSKLLVILRL